jgi:uncharacterized protein with beta-barrel porin domain
MLHPFRSGLFWPKLVLALLAGLLLPAAHAATSAKERAAAVGQAYDALAAKLGGADKLQAAYAAARGEQGRIDGILLVAGPLETRFRENGATARADQLRDMTKPLGPMQAQLRDKFARLEALGAALDVAAAKAAYDRNYALFGATMDKPALDKWKAFVAHGKLDVDALTAGQAIADTLLAAAR